LIRHSDFGSARSLIEEMLSCSPSMYDNSATARPLMTFEYSISVSWTRSIDLWRSARCPGSRSGRAAAIWFRTKEVWAVLQSGVTFEPLGAWWRLRAVWATPGRARSNRAVAGCLRAVSASHRGVQHSRKPGKSLSAQAGERNWLLRL